MPSPKLIQILRSRSDLTDAQIIEMSDDQAWAVVYEIDAREKAARDANKKDTVCFTGFNREDKAQLEALAVERGLKSVGSVSKSLTYLVIGDTPGESKLAQVEAAGCRILHAHEFQQLFK